MAQLQLHQACNILKGIHEEILSNYRSANNNKFISRKKRDISDQTVKIGILNKGRRGLLLQVHCTASTPSSSSSSSSSTTTSVEEVKNDVAEGRDYSGGDSSSTTKDGGSGVLVSENGWKVRRMIESDQEMRMVASIQAEAFHQPVFFFNNLLMESFKAEVLSGLIYRLRNSPPNRYACLVAEPSMTRIQQLIGVVDITVLRDNDTLQYLEDAEEYLYVSGIAVSRKFRRQKVATALLGACEKVSNLWGFEYLALRAYEDDSGACTLYKNAGFFVVGKDPEWMTTWLGRRRRVLMIKRSNNKKLVAFQTQDQKEAKDVHTS